MGTSYSTVRGTENATARIALDHLDDGKCGTISNKTAVNRCKRGPMVAGRRAVEAGVSLDGRVGAQWSVVRVTQSFSGPRHEAD